jgi:hypothetical protein
MNHLVLHQFAAWSAYLNAAANLVGAISLALLFAGNVPFGRINDASSVFFALTLIPVALAFHQLHRSVAAPSSLMITVVGILAMLTAATLSALLVFGQVGFEQTLRAVLSANAIIGVWLVASGVLSLVGSSLPRGLAWVLVAAGAGLVLVIVGFWIGGQQHPLTAVGGLVAFFGNLIWTIWLGNLLMAGTVRPHLPALGP